MVESVFAAIPELTENQKVLLSQLGPLYAHWNQKINVISRKDVDHFYLHHVLHSLIVTKWIEFQQGTNILDLGTGGGFPGIPLAIRFPDVSFHLVDARKKKIQVVKEIVKELHLNNVTMSHGRAEDMHQTQFDYITSRAVASLRKLWDWSNHLIHIHHKNSYPNGFLIWKGGEQQINREIREMPRGTFIEKFTISDHLLDDYFKEKFILYIQK